MRGAIGTRVPFWNVVSKYRAHCYFNSGIVHFQQSPESRRWVSLSVSHSVLSVSDLRTDLIKELIERRSLAAL